MAAENPPQRPPGESESSRDPISQTDDRPAVLRLEEALAAAARLKSELAQEIAAHLDTARKLAEKARLLDLTEDAIIVRDIEGPITYWNHGAELLYGWSREEALGKECHTLLQTESATPSAQILEELHGTGRWTGELVHTRRDGRRVTVLVRKALDRDQKGEPRAVLQGLTDISERRRVQDALHMSEARFRTAIGIVSSLIWTNDARGMMAGEQPGWESFTGQTQEEYQGYGWAQVVHPDDAQPTVDAWGKAVAEKRLFDFEHRLRRADGEWRLCSIRAAPLLDENGNIVEWVGVHTDITDRNRSEERVRAFVTASSDIVYRMNADWSEMGALDGRNFIPDTAEPSRTWLADNVHPDDQALVASAIREALRTKSIFALEHRIQRVDGEIGWIASKAVPIFDAQGEIAEWFGAASDITERRQAEEKLRAKEEFMRSIIESSPDCIKVLDPQGILLSVEAGQELLGMSQIEPYLGSSWLDFWKNPEDRRAAQEAVLATAAGGEGNFVGFFRTLQGEGRWWDVAISPIRDAEGNTEQLLAVSRDVTKRREMEESLVARAEDLVRADRSKDEFLAMLAHELRNPLAPLRNAAEILQSKNASADEQAQAQQIIGRQIENMSRMIDDLLDVSRITEGKIELRKKPVSLEEVLTAASSLARSSSAARQQVLAVDLPDRPVFLNADATRLEQIFSNLLNNASKYSGEGTHIFLSAEVVSAAQPPEVIVRVRDDGAGIDPELLPRVFDLFVQETRSLDRAHGGLGIGLTLVSRLVKLHGGSVEAHSAGLGQGSEFIVRLPILQQAPLPVVPPLPVAQQTSLRILIVDDNADSARSMAILQTRRGHVTRVAYTGPDALAVAIEFLPEVVLLDIGLPGMDGYEVARHLRQDSTMAGVLLIAMTGYASPEDLAAATQAGFDEHLVKPVDLEKLRLWLQRHTSRST